jgi:hypothetical protein
MHVAHLVLSLYPIHLIHLETHAHFRDPLLACLWPAISEKKMLRDKG